MPTLVTITVKPSGGDYTSLNTALAAVASNLTVSDEQVTIECDTFTGGLAERVTIPSITQDATRYLVVKAAAGHEYNHVDDSGFYLTASVAFGATLSNSQSFTQFYDIGAKNTRTLGNARVFDCFGSNNVISGCYGESSGSAGSIVFFLNNATNLDISYCLSFGGTTGFDFGNNFTRTALNLTSVDASSVGFDTGTADTTIKNSFSFGSSDPYLGTFNASSTNNAGDSTDTPGAFPQNNRTSADFVNYAFGDYRTASSSALATAGDGGTFIGFELEAATGGFTLDVDGGVYSYSGGDVSLLVSRILSTDGGNYSYSGSDVTLTYNPLTGYDLDIDGGVYSYAGQSLELLQNRVLSVDGGSYSYTGSDLALLADKVLNIDGGAYSYIGSDVTLTYNELGSYTLDIDGGLYAYTGSDVSLLADRLLNVDGGLYDYTGGDLTFLYGLVFDIDGGLYISTGGDVNFAYDRVMQVSGGLYSYTGGNVVLTYSGQVTLLIDGYSVQFKQDEYSATYQGESIGINYGSLQ